MRACTLVCRSVSFAQDGWVGRPCWVTGVVFFQGAVIPVGVEATAGEGGGGTVSGAVERGFGSSG